MYIEADSPYHIYNQGNNKEVIFRKPNDYGYFLQRLKKWLYPVADIAAYCIMPNHFHLLIFANDKSIQTLKVGSLQLNELSNALRLCQSQYAQYFNKNTIM